MKKNTKLSKQEYKEFATLFFEYKDLIDDNERILRDIKTLSELTFHDIESALMESKIYEKKLNYIKFQGMNPYQKQETLTDLIERIDKMMSLQTRLNIARDRAKHIKYDKRNKAKIQQKIRRLSLVDPISTIDDIPRTPYKYKENVKPAEMTSHDRNMRSNLFLSEEKPTNYALNTPHESPNKRKRPLGLHVRNAMSCTTENLEFMKGNMEEMRRLAIEEKKKELELLKKKNLQLVKERSELNHQNLYVREDIDNQLKTLGSEFSQKFKSDYENLHDCDKGLVAEPIENQREALKKYLKINYDAKRTMNNHMKCLDGYESFKDVVNENALLSNPTKSP